MQRVSLRLSVALITFFIGIVAVSIWLFNHQVNSDVASANVSISAKNVAADEPSSISVIDEEYAVYSAILTDRRYNNEVIVINNYTSHGLIADADNLISERIDILTKDTIADYQFKNEDNKKLENNFSLGSKVVFLSEKEHTRLFCRGLNGWAEFYKKHPKAKGIISFSRIGFNQTQTQALVSISFGCGGQCGNGKFIVLQKEKGKWNTKRDIGLWVS